MIAYYYQEKLVTKSSFADVPETIDADDIVIIRENTWPELVRPEHQNLFDLLRRFK